MTPGLGTSKRRCGWLRNSRAAASLGVSMADVLLVLVLVLVVVELLLLQLVALLLGGSVCVCGVAVGRLFMAAGAC